MSDENFGFHNPPLEKENTCGEHGLFIDKCYLRKNWIGCPVCNQIKADAEKVLKEDAERVQAQFRWQQRIGDAGIPERFMTRTLATYLIDDSNEKQKRILQYCVNYAANFSENRKTGLSFLMLGLPGTGKTHLSIGIALEIMRAGRTAIFTTASKMLRAVKDTYHKESEYSEKQVMEIYEKCDLLILDEVGVQRGSDFEKDMLFDVINARYENMRPTIILSNLTIEECKLYLGERVFDRMREGGGKAFLLDWPSYRSKK